MRFLKKDAERFLALHKWLAFLIVAILMLLPVRTMAQEFRATISGTVADQTGAVVPKAKIIVQEARTGAIHETASGSIGQYVVPQLPPGEYSIIVTKAGFETLVRAGIVLQAQEHPILNLTMTVGRESLTVTVTAETPLLNQANAAIGSVISTESVADLPMNGYAPVMLAALSVGVIPTAHPGNTTAYDPSALNSWSIGGTTANKSEILLDGAADTEISGLGNGGAAFVPTQDSVGEVAIHTFDTDASLGHTLGGVINQVTKGGTNAFHGTAYEFGQFSDLAANLYFNGRSKSPTPLFHYNQYGVTAGGPILIPKVINGKNKLFFFFAWEGIRTITPATTIFTVPTDAEKKGDFSALLNGGSSYQLYEPNTGTLQSGAYTRAPVPNNCLTNKSDYCATVANAGLSIDAIAANYLKLYPESNYTSGVSSVTNQNNYNDNAPNYVKYSTEFGRLDYNLNAHNHMFFQARHNQSMNGVDYFKNYANSNVLFRGNDGITVDNVFTVNATTVLDTRFDWISFKELHTSPTNRYSPTSMGFPSYLGDTSLLPTLPNMNFSGYEALGDNKAQSLDPADIYQAFADLIKVVGRHTLKIGFDGRSYRQRIQGFSASSGSFSFNTSFVTCGTGCSSQPFGGDLASFEYGLPASGSYSITPMGDYRSYYVASFIQDDWAVNNRLTLNLGLRFDIDTPYGEKFGRTESGFDPNAVNTASVTAAAKFASTSVSTNNTNVAISNINTLGGLIFPNMNGGAPYQIQNKAGFWSPRVGFSYNPARLGKTVVRGGLGFFVLPQSLQGNSYQPGFSSTTSYDATSNNYFSSDSTLDNPFPNGFTQPVGASLGASTFLGSPSSISFWGPMHDEYSERWTFGIQQSLTSSTLLGVMYEGNHALHLPVSRNINAVKGEFLTTNPYRNQNLATSLGTSVTNPFVGLLSGGNSSYNGATTSLSNLTVPYPQFGGSSITEQMANGQSFFEEGMVHLEQRAKHGLTLTANYSYAKSIEQYTYLNQEDTKLYRELSPTIDFRHHFTVGAVYQLPFGHNKEFSFGGNRLMDELTGGWVLNAIYQFQTGLPLSLSDIPFQPGMSIKNIKSNPRNTSTTSPALTNASSVFVTGSGTKCTVAAGQMCDGTTFFNGQYSNHYRTLPVTINSVRMDGNNNLDSSMLKNFAFTKDGKAYLQIRFETFNTLNHATFSGPNLSATSSSFGYISGVTNNPRQVQLGGRIVF